MKVLITYASAGAGHRRAAEAVYDYLKSNRKDLELELMDILPQAVWLLRFCYNSGYRFLVHYAVWLWGFFFWLTEFSLTRRLSRKASCLINYFLCRRFVRYLKKENFDFVISTHFLNSELAANLKLKNKIQSKLITIITDFGVHPFWISEGTFLYVAASGITKHRLLRMGIEEQMVKEFGIPSAPGFLKIQDREQLAGKLGIEAGKFTVLVMTGSFGVGPLEEIAESLCADTQVLVVCGRNKTLLKRLEKKKLSNVLVFGFINNAEELMAVSDVIITKPGGSSIAELLNMGLSPVFIAAIPGQERENIKVLAAYQVGCAANNIKQIKGFVLDLKNNPQKLASLQNNIARIKKPFACRELADVIR